MALFVSITDLATDKLVGFSVQGITTVGEVKALAVAEVRVLAFQQILAHAFPLERL